MGAVKNVVLENIIFALPEFIPHLSGNIKYIVAEMSILGPAIPVRAKHCVNLTPFGDVENIVIDFSVTGPAADVKNAGAVVPADIITDDRTLAADISR